jgi:hypothetical protein
MLIILNTIKKEHKPIILKFTHASVLKLRRVLIQINFLQIKEIQISMEKLLKLQFVNHINSHCYMVQLLVAQFLLLLSLST